MVVKTVRQKKHLKTVISQFFRSFLWEPLKTNGTPQKPNIRFMLPSLCFASKTVPHSGRMRCHIYPYQHNKSVIKVTIFLFLLCQETKKRIESTKIPNGASSHFFSLLWDRSRVYRKSSRDGGLRWKQQRIQRQLFFWQLFEQFAQGYLSKNKRSIFQKLRKQFLISGKTFWNKVCGNILHFADLCRSTR